MRGGFPHHATLLVDGRTNRARLHADPTHTLPVPVLVLPGDVGAPPGHPLDGVRRVASDMSAATVRAAGHALPPTQIGSPTG